MTAAALHYLRQARALEGELKELQRAYAKLTIRYAVTVDALHVEEQRAVRVAMLLTEPCTSCGVFTEERDAAIHEAEGLRLALDAEIATRVWLERVGWGKAKA